MVVRDPVSHSHSIGIVSSVSTIRGLPFIPSTKVESATNMSTTIAYGILIIVFASTSSNLGVNIQKYSFLQEDIRVRAINKVLPRPQTLIAEFFTNLRPVPNIYISFHLPTF